MRNIKKPNKLSVFIIRWWMLASLSVLCVLCFYSPWVSISFDSRAANKFISNSYNNEEILIKSSFRKILSGGYSAVKLSGGKSAKLFRQIEKNPLGKAIINSKNNRKIKLYGMMLSLYPFMIPLFSFVLSRFRYAFLPRLIIGLLCLMVSASQIFIIGFKSTGIFASDLYLDYGFWAGAFIYFLYGSYVLAMRKL